MWLMILQLALVIIAGLRGWKWTPVWIFLGVIFFAFLAGAGFGLNSFPLLSIIDYGITVIFLIMAIVGNKDVNQPKIDDLNVSQIEDRVKCPYCSELIIRDARFCRFCGKELNVQNDPELFE